ncbi:MAG: AAA family ATPase [Clostridia bacterium]|nr:AAA family ATPase [Clostridia bacterium]
MEKRIVLLNGPSSSGKSTLSGALKALIARELSRTYEVVSVDDFMKTDPMETIYEDDVYEISGDLCARVREAAEACDGVIVDHVITSERIFLQLREAVRAYGLCTVHVTCAPEILARRERERGDRCPGSAASSTEYLYPKEGYDLTVDTGIRTPEENARIILGLLPV